MPNECVMGCPPGQQLHVFPKSKSKRAEWCRILGVYPRTKRAYLCNAHIPECYLFGNRLSKFATPSPPDHMSVLNSKIYRLTKNENENYLLHNRHAESAENSIPIPSQKFLENEANDAYFAEDPLDVNSVEIELSAKDENKTVESKETSEKVETFEIRKKSNNDMIIKGRYFQTNDYVVVSYTPPKKWTLQEQVKILGDKYTQQLRQIRILNRENYRLLVEQRKYEKLLPKLRYLQQNNRLLYAELKMYKINERYRRKRIKAKKLKEKRLEENQVISLE